MSGILDDVRGSVRGLVKNRGFAITAILSLALGTGANTTIFTLVNALLLRPLPVSDAASLSAVYTRDQLNPGDLLTSYPNYKDYRDRNQAFSSVALYSVLGVTLTGTAEPQRLVGQVVSGNYFDTLGVLLALGRAFTPAEDATPNAAPVAVIGYKLWMGRFGGDPGVTRRKLELNGLAYDIVGVAPRGFQGLDTLISVDVWIPMTMYQRVYPFPALVEQRRALLFSVVGRLRPGLTARQAEAALNSVAVDLEREYPQDNRGRRIRLVPLSEAAISPGNRAVIVRAGTALTVVAALVLLIACGNVSNLLLARAAARRKEIAVRLAMGATRFRLVRQMLIESLTLAVPGGIAGLALARWARDILWAARPPLLTFSGLQLDLDGRVLAFALAVSIAATVLAGLVPALRAARTNLASDLRDRGARPASMRVRNALVMGQLALSLVALIGAGLFVRSLSNAARVNMGFEPRGLGIVAFNLADRHYGEDRGREFQRLALERAAALPGVISAAEGNDPPFGVSLARTVLPEGQDQTNGRFALTTVISPGYLKTLGIPLVAGRDFAPTDTRDAERVAIVNEAAAAYYWPGRDPVGQRLRFFGDPRVWMVIGMAKNANYQTIGERPQDMIYLSLGQYYSDVVMVYIRTAGDPAAAVAAERSQVQRLDRGLWLQSETLDTTIREALWAPRLAAALLTALGGLALALAMIGVYGVISYMVSRQRAEIGVRMAMGATPRDVLLGVLRKGLTMAAGGALAGIAVALVAARAIESLLLATSARDAATFTLVPTLLLLAVLAACWLPALRASRVEPAQALRDE